MPLLTNKLGLSAQFGKAQLGYGQSQFDGHLNATKCLGQDTSAIPGSDLAADFLQDLAPVIHKE